MNKDKFFTKIGSEYKKSWELLCDWMRNNLDSWNIRDLYDFFDENGITVNPRPIFYAGDEIPDYWSFDIGGVCKDHRFRVKTRPEAETAAFEKAFEILENKLK